MSDYIPDHILANVLLRLPFDSLIRLRCVSKSWRDLIDIPHFIEMHSRRSCLMKPNLHPESGKIIALIGTQLYTFDSLVKVGSACKAVAKPLSSPPIEFSDRELDLVGSCNGILCLWNVWTDYLVLWNPFTRSCSAVPPAPFEFTKECRASIQAAFGYDPHNDDYKLVKWNIYADLAHHLNDLPSSRRYELYVYSLKQNSWRRIRDAIPFELPQYYYFFPDDWAFANGAVHWLVTDCTGRIENFIVAFDLGSYEFRKMPCCHFTINPRYTWTHKVKLSSLNGCLSVVSYSCSAASPQRRGEDVWVMEDYGVENSWNQLASIDLPNDPVIWELHFQRKGRKCCCKLAGKSWCFMI